MRLGTVGLILVVGIVAQQPKARIVITEESVQAFGVPFAMRSSRFDFLNHTIALGKLFLFTGIILI